MALSQSNKKESIKKPMAEGSRNKKEKISQVLFTAGLSLLYFGLSFSAFSSQVRKDIKERSEGYCDGCGTYVGTENLIAAHINHQRGKGYNSRSNGVAHCLRCETKYHLSYADSPQLIGLTKTQNDATTYGHLVELSQEEQDTITAQYPQEWLGVQKRLGRLR